MSTIRSGFDENMWKKQEDSQNLCKMNKLTALSMREKFAMRMRRAKSIFELWRYVMLLRSIEFKESFDDDEKNLHRDFERLDFKFCLFIPASVKLTRYASNNLLSEKKRLC